MSKTPAFAAGGAMPAAVNVIPFPLKTHAATATEMATLEFEPWKRLEGEKCPVPTNTEWNERVNPWLVTLRMAWRTMHMTKVELMEGMGALDEETGQELQQGFTDSLDFFRGMVALLEAAEVRLLSAGAAAALEEELADV